jgi:hypothetical protein
LPGPVNNQGGPKGKKWLELASKDKENGSWKVKAGIFFSVPVEGVKYVLSFSFLIKDPGTPQPGRSGMGKLN